MRMPGFLVIAAVFLTSVSCPAVFSQGVTESGDGGIVVSLELPLEISEFWDEDSVSYVKNLIPSSFSLLEISGDRIVLEGLRKDLPNLEAAGLEIVEISPASPDAKAGAKSKILSLSFEQSWGPLEYPHQVVTDLLSYFIPFSEAAILVGTRNLDWSAGKVYFYDWQGILQWEADFPQGVARINTSNLSREGNNEIIVTTQNFDNTQSGVYVYDIDGNYLGSWTSESCGINRLYYFYDLDDGGTREIVVRPEDCDTFHVLDHNGNLLWSGSVTDNIAGMSFQDLYGDNKRQIIVFSRDRTIPRGQITVFDPETGTARGSRSYTDDDIRFTLSPSMASYLDLTGDGIREIIPSASSLDQKFEILAADGELLHTEYLDRRLSSFNVANDFTGNGRNDIVLLATSSTPSELLVHGYLGFTGSGFESSWTYPTAPLDKSSARLSVTEDRIALGTRDTTTFSGCHIYLLNPADGTEAAPPREVAGSVNDLEYGDLNNDGSREVAILANVYTEPTQTWTFYAYDRNLDLLADSGHFSFQSDTGRYSSSSFVSRDMDGDGVFELIPSSLTTQRFLGNTAVLVDYRGILKWSYAAPGQINNLRYTTDIDGDGSNELVVTSDTAGGGHIAILKDRGSSFETLGERYFPGPVESVRYSDLSGDRKREIMPQLTNIKNRFVYSYDLSEAYWDFSPDGDEVEVMDFLRDLDRSGVRDILVSSNDAVTPKGYVYVFFGAAEKASAPWITDFSGDGASDIAVFRAASGLWAVRGVTRVYFGGTGDLPVPGDYSGDGITDIAVFRPSSGLWAVRGGERTYFGGIGDLPVPGDYDGSGTADIGIFRETSGLWAIRGVTRAYFGRSGDVPIPGYYGPEGHKSIGLYRPAAGLWAVRGVTRAYFGSAADTPVPGDYSGDGQWDLGVFRPSAGLWAVRGVTRAYFGGSADSPLPADCAGDGTDDIGIFRGTSGLWAIRGVTRVYFGSGQDVPVTR